MGGLSGTIKYIEILDMEEKFPYEVDFGKQGKIRCSRDWLTVDGCEKRINNEGSLIQGRPSGPPKWKVGDCVMITAPSLGTVKTKIQVVREDHTYKLHQAGKEKKRGLEDDG